MSVENVLHVHVLLTFLSKLEKYLWLIITSLVNPGMQIIGY